MKNRGTVDGSESRYPEEDCGISVFSISLPGGRMGRICNNGTLLLNCSRFNENWSVWKRKNMIF